MRQHLKYISLLPKVLVVEAGDPEAEASKEPRQGQEEGEYREKVGVLDGGRRKENTEGRQGFLMETNVWFLSVKFYLPSRE